MLSIILLSSLVLTTAVTFLLISARGHFRIIDHPNERSLHTHPTPRTGGVAILLGILAGLIVLGLSYGLRGDLGWIFSAVLLVGAVSFVDDRAQVPISIRLIVHLTASILLLVGGNISLSSLWPGAEAILPITSIWLFILIYLIWMTNLYNFMDGMDGFAGGMTVFGFGTLGLLGFLAGDNYYATICWVIAVSTAGFLVWNFPPARIFMGDTGSSALGFLAAALSLLADRNRLFPFWLAMLIFAPFIFDATLTLARRTFQGERIWQAHRSHYYQRLVQAGWSHRRTVLWEYGLMLLCNVGALCAFHASKAWQWVVIGVILSTCLAGVIGVRHVERRQLARRIPEISL